MTSEEIKIKCLEIALAIGPYYDGCGPLKTVQEIANELYSWVTDTPKKQKSGPTNSDKLNQQIYDQLVKDGKL